METFLAQVRAMPKGGGEARLIFALDATASRESTWDVASNLQTEMFLSTRTLDRLNVQLCWFRGFNEFFSSGWQTSADELLRLMSRIHCHAGATQLERVLRHALAENARKGIKCVVYIGDCMEENLDRLAELAGQLGLLRVPLFMFLEGNDPVARKAFMELSRLSGGAWSPFNSASVEQLKQLLQAVAIYAAGGRAALADFSRTAHRDVKLLERQLGH